MLSTSSSTSANTQQDQEALKAGCLSQQKKPLLDKGQTLNNGRFYRNLKKRDVGLNYQESPQYGYRLKNFKNWSMGDSGFLELSVNEIGCACSAKCSILIQVNSDQYEHVWEIDLDSLNDLLSDVDDMCVAQYDPEPPNVCHFLIVTSEGVLTPALLICLLDGLAKRFPPEDKETSNKGNVPPRGREQEALTLAQSYADYITIHRFPLTVPPTATGVNPEAG